MPPPLTTVDTTDIPDTTDTATDTSWIQGILWRLPLCLRSLLRLSYYSPSNGFRKSMTRTRTPYLCDDAREFWISLTLQMKTVKWDDLFCPSRQNTKLQLKTLEKSDWDLFILCFVSQSSKEVPR